VAAEARELERSEEPRRPAHEAQRTVRKDPALPGPAPAPHAAPPAPPPAVPVAPPRPAPATAPPTAAALRAPLPPGPDAPGVDGAVLPHAAHLRIEPAQPGLGEIELHLRVRGGVAHLRVDGEGSHAVAASVPELASALAGAGLTLGQLDVPPPRPAATPAPSSGGADLRSGSDGRGAGFDPPAPGGGDARERGAPPPPPPPPPGRRDRTPSGGRIHVEA
jgi:hypothetical protein